ncbi:hypothetical protein YC2023_061548 [Brassica napus]
MCRSFIVSFLNNESDPEKDSAAVQDFFSKMEAAFMAHPIWSGCSEDELDSAGDVRSREVCHDKAVSPCLCFKHRGDVISDEKLFQKMSLVQQFISPEYLCRVLWDKFGGGIV